ncbi:MAG TPA: hypothetical protein VN778_02790 [Verrucomicrobiae bacterium]|nr:hypothetical protein [Verrucomicrobiae bacterium]
MRNQRPVRLLVTAVGFSLLFLGLTPVSASSANISHSFHADSTISNGSIVSLEQQKSDYVELANTSNGSRLLGVAVASTDSLLAVDPGQGTVQVATTGTASTLVSTFNGAIKVGDQIAVSPFSGIGMEAAAGSRIIGLAQTAFDGTDSNAVTQQITDKSGKTKQIRVGYVRLTIGVGSNPVDSGGEQLNSLQKMAKSLTGHTVSTARIIISLLVALVATVSLIVLIYASIYGSIISIGRNPLAKYAVFRTLSSVLGMAALTALVAASIIFFLLR